MKVRCQYCKGIFELMEYDYDKHHYGDCCMTEEDKRNNVIGMISFALFAASIMVFIVILPTFLDLFGNIGFFYAICISLCFVVGSTLLMMYDVKGDVSIEDKTR